MSENRFSRPLSDADIVLRMAAVALTLGTAYIHLTLGGVLFTLNGLGYLGLAVLFVIGAVAPLPLVDRFSWLPRVSLAGYAALTIGAYLVIGPYFSLGWIAKSIELGIIGLVALDVYRVYGLESGHQQNQRQQRGQRQ